MEKSILIICVLLVSFTLSEAQVSVDLYFNAKWETANKEKAVYKLQCQYNSQNPELSGKVVMKGFNNGYLIEGNYLNGQRNGDFTFFYSNGQIESKGLYLNNKRAGKWTYYYPNGKIKQVLSYSTTKEWNFKGIDYFDKTGRQLMKNGTGTWINDSILIAKDDQMILTKMVGQFKDSLKSGIWKFYSISDQKIIKKENFRKDELKSVKIRIVPYYYNSDSPSIIGQRVQEEMKTGIAHKNLVEDSSEKVEIGDVNWRNLQQTGNATPGPSGQIAIDNFTSSGMKLQAKNSYRSSYRQEKAAFTFIHTRKEDQTAYKNPDLYDEVLKRIEFATEHKFQNIQK